MKIALLVSTAAVGGLLFGCSSLPSNDSADKGAEVKAADSLKPATVDSYTLRNAPPEKVQGVIARAIVRASADDDSPLYYAEPPRFDDEYSQRDDQPYSFVSSTPVSTFSVDVDNASYTNVRRFIMENILPPADAVRTEEMINYFEYPGTASQDGADIQVSSALVAAPWNDRYKLMRVAIAGREVDYDDAPPANLVFLVDVSGSMEGDDRLGLLQRGLTLMIGELRPQDRVSIVTYAGRTEVLLPPTGLDKKDSILSAIRNLSSGGGTAGGAGITLAYEQAEKNFLVGGNNRIILATDGDFNVGIKNTDELKEYVKSRRSKGIYLTVLGVGRGNLKDDRMEALAQAGSGNYFYLDNIREAQRVLSGQVAGTLLTVADDVKVQVEFNPVTVQAYRLIGYENRMLRREDFTNDSVDAGDIGAGQVVTALYEIVPMGVSIDQAPVEPLKYSSGVSSGNSEEMLTIKVRYKKPGTAESIPSEYVVDVSSEVEFDDADHNTRFSVAVAAFGQKLRANPAVASVSWGNIRSWASDADEGLDEREEFVGLVRSAELLEKTKPQENK